MAAMTPIRSDVKDCPSSLVHAICDAMFATTSFTAAAVGAVAMGIGLALMYPALSLIVAAGVAPHDRGIAMGAFTTFVDIGLAGGALLGGLIVTATSTVGAFWVAAAAAALACVIVTVTAPRRNVELAARGIS